MEISVILPAYNEEKRIGPTIRKVKRYLKKFKRHEIIVVDDGSTDKTADIARKLNVKVLSRRENRGKGYSVKEGILAAKYDLILFSDSDLATPIEELDKLMSQITKNDIVIASRNIKGAIRKIKQGFFRQLLGKGFAILVRFIALPGIYDSQCGFKLFRKRCAKEIIKHQRIERFGFDVELIFIARKLGFRVKEVPVLWIDKEGSKVNPMTDPIKMLFEVLKVRFNGLLGRYS